YTGGALERRRFALCCRQRAGATGNHDARRAGRAGKLERRFDHGNGGNDAELARVRHLAAINNDANERSRSQSRKRDRATLILELISWAKHYSLRQPVWSCSNAISTTSPTTSPTPRP